MEANATLRQSGLRGRDSGREQSAKYRPGTVARQDPRPGDPIPQNRVIAYWLAPVSTGLVDQLKRWLHVVTVADVVKILGALAAIFLVAFILTKLIPHHKIKVVPLKDYGEQHVTSPPGPL